ncbi:hypothetical protein Q7P35_003719 [Cladosporium inversicolor]
MAPARRSSRKTGATGATSTPPLSTPVPASQPAKQTTLKFAKINTRQHSTPEARPKRHFLDLPAEIRVLIYTQMFPRDRLDVYAIKGSLHKAEHVHHVAGDHLAMLTTCRTIYTEAELVLYENTEFCLHIRDHYWLHFWDTEHYEETFEVEDYLEEPHSYLWAQWNPWLQDLRSIVPLDNVHILTLAVECSTGGSACSSTWTGQFKHSLRAASKIQKLHIELKNPYEESPHQQTTNFMFELFEYHINCRGTVTAEMDLVLGSTKFDSASYYRMLDHFKGQVFRETFCRRQPDVLRIDKTYDVFSTNLADLQAQHAKTVQQLRNKITSLRSETEGRIKFAETQSTWTNYSTMKVVPAKSKTNIEGILREMVHHESRLQVLEEDMALLKRRFESLKVRSKE